MRPLHQEDQSAHALGWMLMVHGCRLGPEWPDLPSERKTANLGSTWTQLARLMCAVSITSSFRVEAHWKERAMMMW